MFGQSQCTVSAGQSEQTALVERRGFEENDAFEEMVLTAEHKVQRARLDLDPIPPIYIWKINVFFEH